MEMNNSVFYKVNSNSSCFADVKLSQNVQTLKLENHHFFLSQTERSYFLGLLVLV